MAIFIDLDPSYVSTGWRGRMAAKAMDAITSDAVRIAKDFLKNTIASSPPILPMGLNDRPIYIFHFRGNGIYISFGVAFRIISCHSSMIRLRAP
ncbi:hypothetical protein JS562_16200 [Agrobacterium sp. S2]|nr:hypothetical protein [Agrobacterium sp. S2]